MPKSRKPIIPLLHMWETYPEHMKHLLKDPLGATVRALKKADEYDDWEAVSKATELLTFLSEEVLS
jgi:hypothetical protein